jgi:predicted metal-binding protein
MLFVTSYGAEKKLTSPPHNLSKEEFEKLMTEVANIFDGKEWTDIVLKLTWVSII